MWVYGMCCLRQRTSALNLTFILFLVCVFWFTVTKGYSFLCTVFWCIVTKDLNNNFIVTILAAVFTYNFFYVQYTSVRKFMINLWSLNQFLWTLYTYVLSLFGLSFLKLAHMVTTELAIYFLTSLRFILKE